MSLQRRNRNRGKATEKAIAKMTGGKRIGVLGSEDVLHPVYSIETKSKQSFVASSWFEQCERNNKEHKIPLLVVHVRGRRHNNDFAILKLTDLMALSDLAEHWKNQVNKLKGD